MKIGTLRHRITIQEDTGTTRDSFNIATPSWTTLNGGKVFARVEPLQGRELIEARQVHANISHRVTCRYVNGVTAKMRVLHGSRELNIRSVSNMEERAWTTILLCDEAV